MLTLFVGVYHNLSTSFLGSTYNVVKGFKSYIALLILPIGILMIKTRSKRNITPEKAIEILATHGTIVTKDQAKLILDFMYKFSILAVNQIVKKQKLKTHGNQKPKQRTVLS